MTKPKKHYFDIVFSLFATVFTALLFIGKIVFLAVGLTFLVADANFGIEGVLTFVFGLFCPMIVISAALAFFAGWKYWYYDDKEIVNGNLFFKTKLAFSDIKSVEAKYIVIGAYPFITNPKEYVFQNGKKKVMIPAYCLSEAEKEWLERQIGHIEHIKW